MENVMMKKLLLLTALTTTCNTYTATMERESINYGDLYADYPDMTIKDDGYYYSAPANQKIPGVTSNDLKRIRDSLIQRVYILYKDKREKNTLLLLQRTIKDLNDRIKAIEKEEAQALLLLQNKYGFN